MRIATFATVATLLVSSASAATAGCGKVPTLKSGTNRMTVNSKTREWILTLPANYDNTRPYKLIYGIHWLTGTMQDVANGGTIKPYYGMPPLMNDTAIFVSPNGLVSGGQSGFANTNGEDIEFIRSINKALDADLCINEKHRYSMGFSYGGAMSYSIACSLAKDFRAVAALSGGPMSGCAGGTDPVAYYGQHGISDSVLNISIGRQIRDTFVKNNGCTAQSPPEPAKGSKTHIKTVYSGCSADHPVTFVAFDGDHTPIPSDSGASKETTFTADEVYKFFSQFQ